MTAVRVARTRAGVTGVAISMASVIAVEIVTQGDPFFSPFTTFASGQLGGVVTIVVGVILFAASCVILAATARRAIASVSCVVLVYGGAFVLNTRLFDAYAFDRERHPATWYLSTVLPLTIATIGLALSWLIASSARRAQWLALMLVAWVPALYSPLFSFALSNGENHPGWQTDRLTALADAVTEAWEFALLVFLPVVLVMLLSVALRQTRRRAPVDGSRDGFDTD